MQILVTGSSGTIGTRLCEKLLERGHEVMGIDWVENKWQKDVEKITTHVDLRDEKALQAVSGKLQADIVVHLAANARVYELVEHPDRARDNFLTLFNTLELARTQGIKKFIFASSREAYGNMGTGTFSGKGDRPFGREGLSPENVPVPFSEDLVRVENCESPYTASKVGGEALVHAYARCYGIDAIIFRFSNVYGMYDDSIRVVPLFIRQARANETLTVFGRDKCLDFTYIDDCVNGIILSIEKFENAKNETINLAYGEGTTIVALAETVKTLLGSSSEITIGTPRTGEVIRYIADISKARKLLGYNPETPFAEGIKKAVEWYNQFRLLGNFCQDFHEGFPLG